MKFAFHAYAIMNLIKTWSGANKTYHHYIPFDAKFYADFEFELKLQIQPTHFEIFAILKFCVGGLKFFFFHQIRKLILSHIICIFCMLNVSRVIYWNGVRNFQRRPATLNFRNDNFETHIRIQDRKLYQNHTWVEKIIFCPKWFTP